MCGICGMYSKKGELINPRRVIRMTESMKHRGPDDFGFASIDGRTSAICQHKEPDLVPESSLLLGHTRLKVIDLSEKAHQPMIYGDYAIVYNGEIYNFQDLKRELKNAGEDFFSASDTEVLLKGYIRWGVKILDKLNGVFALAIWDNLKKELFIARDPLGVKPLYYADNGDYFIFASEVKGILAADLLKADINYPALSQYFVFQNTFGEETIFKNINILLPGTYLIINEKGVHKKQYWEIRFDNNKDLGEDYYIEGLRSVIKDSVLGQLLSDIPVGCYLSGGMDSATNVAFASRRIDRLMTFTCGFDLANVYGLEAAFDERAEAEKISKIFKTKHFEIVLHSGDMAQVLPRLIQTKEELRLGMSYQNYYIAELTSNFVNVVLGGSGGDELFAGYPWRHLTALNAKNVNEFDDFYFKFWQRLVPQDEIKNFFDPSALAKIGDIDYRGIYKGVFDTFKEEKFDGLNRALFFDMKTFLHGLLVIEDKINMAYSVEARVPLIDKKLVDFALSIPSKYKITSEQGKDIFRKAMQGLLPPEILNKKKQGFSTPDRSWYKGDSLEYIHEILYNNKAKNRGFFNYNYIDKAMSEHIKGKVNHRLLIWSLLCFEWWNRIFMD